MKSMKLDVLDDNPFNDPKYVKQRLKDDGVRIKPHRDIVDEEDYQEMLPGLLSEQAMIEKFIKDNNLDVDVSEISFRV
ncbi:hypothetical protein ACWN97_09020 [Pediococcus acidilactici]|uniref:hypothetical protein n=1 Tax=Pediococcus acidilactici TaxID=1254 RepID=UPI001BD6C49A|nr:hypothetical protein [Pediococcus acidilactici]MBS9399890.1 hypothetical protein [Pediococcus acidilactici]WIL71517.1 hypothetical protein QMY06_07835 [Pediococcus acidilactici]